MVTTKYFEQVERLRASQRPIDELDRFDLERLRSSGFGARIASFLIERPRWWLAVLRRLKPTLAVGNFALVTRAADVREVLERQNVFHTPFGPEMADMAGGSNFVLGMQDGRDYRRMKSAILSAFPAAEVETVLRPIAARHAREIMLSARPGFNAAKDLLKVVPVRICRDYFGVLVEDEEEFADWSIALSALFFSDFGGSRDVRDLAFVAAHRMRAVIERSIDAAEPGKLDADMPLARLVAWRRDKPDDLSRDDIVSIMMGMISGFVPTDLLAAGNALDVVLSKREARTAIEEAIAIGDDRRLDRAIMEAMRFKPIFIGPLRYVASDAVIADGTWRRKKLKAGMTVMPATLSAMFDADAVERPGVYDPERPSRDSAMVFGHGIHWCIGSAIARVDIAECFRALFERRNVRRKGRLRRLGAYPEELRVTFDLPADCRTVENSLVTVVAPILPDADRSRVRAMVEQLGNPAAPPVKDALDRAGTIHFASLAVVDPEDGADESAANGHLVLELSGDGDARTVVETFAGHLDPHLRDVFAAGCGLPADGSLAAFLRSRTVRYGPGLGQAAGLGFCGTPGHSVKRILAEADLESDISDIIRTRAEKAPGDATAALAEVREKLAQTGLHDWAFRHSESNLEKGEGSWGGAIRGTVLRPAPAAAILALFAFWTWVNFAFVFDGPYDGVVRNALLLAASAGLTVVGILIVAALLAGALILAIRRKERRDEASNDMLDLDRYDEIARRENHAVQNNLTAVSIMKPGPLRRAALRLAFTVISIAARLVFRPGHLSNIGTIHYARWILLPGTNQLMFFSNYGGSWESYLEDFITKATKGLTGVWSNTRGFPRAHYLFGGGAEDGDRFKRWARNQQIPTLFWYCAYPKLDTARIRTNSLIRQGLSSARSESEAREWLALFGSLPRPANVLETDEIQSIFFGPLGPLEKAEMLMLAVPDEVSPAARRGFVEHLTANVTFGDRMPERRALVAALGPRGLERLGLHGDLDHRPLATFPLAFQQGMTHPTRSRVLDDTGEAAPEKWQWGGPDNPVDIVLSCYGKDQRMLNALVRQTLAAAGAAGLENVARVPLAVKRQGKIAHEHFGFADGLSQPIVTGTPKSHLRADPQHVVAAGEFVFGYADQRGYIPPSPYVEGAYDPAGHLPRFSDEADGAALAKMRDIGRNGSFLVVRQIEQHVDTFETFCRDAARAWEGKVPGEEVTPDWIGAKIIGRWKDGSSLVRNPHGRPTSGPDNSFTFGDEDPQGVRCPLGSHMRRSNPRDSLGLDRESQIEIGKRHRILRVGRTYEKKRRDGSSEKGLVFMCLAADIERQFEFVQQTWVSSGVFHGLRAEKDPLIGSQSGEAAYTIPTVSGGVVLKGLPNFVTVRGGGYFFMPGKSALRYMAARLAG
ncbi:MAG: cytochrome P450 [Rhizobiaceae bacterium]|nr:cytochrome P450 [Rhizobiaceae bacterium]MCV0405806.1 cytochrome P450 [Rhizobiaceae bacterium]